MSQAVLNISCYQFVQIDDPAALRWPLLGTARACHLKGTVLLAQEGINLFMAGPSGGVRAFVDYLRGDARFAGLTPKESWSEAVPFQRLQVKVKREIIRMDHPEIQPQQGRAPSVSAATLARWLDRGHDDAGRPVVTLDTRNAFEVDHGAFDGAIDWRLHKFSDFPPALAAHLPELRDKTVVSYCTGGIRCEKAVIHMQRQGLLHVYQLEGGILQYFEETEGAPHWHGRCFVFDAREALDTQLDAPQGVAAAPG